MSVKQPSKISFLFSIPSERQNLTASFPVSDTTHLLNSSSLLFATLIAFAVKPALFVFTIGPICTVGAFGPICTFGTFGFICITGAFGPICTFGTFD
jgi:hypothetical protein